MDIDKIIDKEAQRIMEEFKIKIDDRIVSHMKEEYAKHARDRQVGMSLYAMQKQIDEIQTKLTCLDLIVTDLSSSLDRYEEDE